MPLPRPRLFGRKAPAAPAGDLPDAPPRQQIGAARDRQRVSLTGEIVALQTRPHGASSWLEATLSDGTGEVVLTWMGRAQVPGVEAGRSLSVEGRLSAADGQLRLYNPRYTLL